MKKLFSNLFVYFLILSLFQFKVAKKDISLDYFISFRKYNKKLRAIYMTNNPVNTKSKKFHTKMDILKNHKISLIA